MTDAPKVQDLLLDMTMSVGAEVDVALNGRYAGALYDKKFGFLLLVATKGAHGKLEFKITSSMPYEIQAALLEDALAAVRTARDQQAPTAVM